MSQERNWKLFIDTSKKKADVHKKVATFWYHVDNCLGLVLIIIAAVTTVLSAIETTPRMVTVWWAGVSTLMTAISTFLQPAKQHQKQSDAAKQFRSLALKMIRCETDEEYENLWVQYNKTLATEPFVPFKIDDKIQPSMTPELQQVIQRKKKKEERLEQRANTVHQEQKSNISSKGITMDKKNIDWKIKQDEATISLLNPSDDDFELRRL